MTAVWYRARAELRARWRASLALAALLGIGGGIVLGVAAAGDRTETAYSRFLRAHMAYDVLTSSGASGAGLAPLDLDAAVALPQVASYRMTRMFFNGIDTDRGTTIADGETGLLTDFKPLTKGSINSPKVLSGRLPDPRRPDEVALAFPLAQQHHIPVGAHLVVKLFTYRVLDNFDAIAGIPVAARAPATVVGIIAVPGGFPPNPTYFQVLGTPAFNGKYAATAGSVREVFIRLKGGRDDVAAFKRELDAMAGGREQFITQADTQQVVERTTHLPAAALLLFALIAGATVMLIITQTIAREAFLDSLDHPLFSALGMNRVQLAASGIARAGLIAVAGSIVAAAVGFLLSPIGPYGLARTAEPSPGFALNVAVVLGGAAAELGLILLIGFVAFSLRARFPTGEQDTGEHARTRVADLLSRVSAPAAAVAGVRLALARGRGRGATPVVSTIAGATVATVALVTALSFGSSLQHLLHTPRLYGWNWDAGAGNPFGPDESRHIPALSSDRLVGAFAMGTTNVHLHVVGKNGTSSDPVAWAFEQQVGTVHPTIGAGRWPDAPDEIALGARVMRRLHASIGDSVLVSGAAGSAEMRVVGRAAFPSQADESSGGVGDSVGTTFAALQRFVPSVTRNVVAVRFATGADPRAAMDSLRKIFPGYDQPQGDIRPDDLSRFQTIDRMPQLIGALLALVVATTLVHALVTAVRRRKRDLALLKVLGFVRGQVRRTVAWQATTLATIALVIGLPFGVALSRAAWTSFATSAGFIAVPFVDVGVVLLLVPIAWSLANLIALGPAESAARTRPASVLRTE